MTESERHADTIRAYFASINAEQFDAVAALFAQDGEAPRALHGVVARPRSDCRLLRGGVAPLSGAFRRSGANAVRGDSATVEIHYTGRHTSGTPIEFDAVDVFDFNSDGKIRKLTSWYDSYTVRATLRRIRESAEAAPG